MFFKYGSYTHANNEVNLSSFRRTTIYNDRGIPQRENVSMRITGVLLGDTQDALTTKIAALEAAYAVRGGDAALYQDDGAGSIGSITPHKIISSDTISGTRVDAITWLGIVNNGEYATGRTYEIALSAELAITESSIVSFAESLSFTGTTGPRDVWIEIRNGPARRQTVSQRTTMRVNQSGQAVGLLSYPNVPAPIFPGLEHVDGRRIIKGSPQFNGEVFTDWPIAWSYEFESAQALVGSPHVN
jgi:hypothetical protein